MMLPIDVKANNAQIVITSKGDIYYQEFRTLNRPKSNRVLIGHLEMINDEIMPIFSEWDMFDSIAFELSHNQKLL
ncbi:MAG TPA: hypothetical protein V6C65_07585, partial [Allocoleopsis sp.]